MVPSAFLSSIIDPALSKLQTLHGPEPSVEAKRLMLAIAMQESSLSSRQQFQGPARSFWQFEMNGIVAVMMNQDVGHMAFEACDALGVNPNAVDVYNIFARSDGDELAACFARLLILADPERLPLTPIDGWNYYLRNWRPGKPRPVDWSQNWLISNETVSTER